MSCSTSNAERIRPPERERTALKKTLTLALVDLTVTSFDATPEAQGAEIAATRNTACATCYTNCLPYC